MKILLHALGAEMGGAMRHLLDFLPALGAYDRENEYRVLVREAFPQIELAPNVGLVRRPTAAARGWIHRLWSDTVSIPIGLRSEGYDVAVSLTNFGPIWAPVPHVFFQRNSLYYCPRYLRTVHGKVKAELFLRRRLAVESMRNAELIVTPSDGMANMIKEAYPSLRDRRFKTLYHGFSKESSRSQLDPSVEENMRTDRLRIVYATHGAPHKGFDVLFRILGGLKKAGVLFKFFTTASSRDWPGMQDYIDQLRVMGLNDEVTFLGRISQSQMGELYEACDLMLYPSFCESFGFPMLEAMSYGLPIVAAATVVNKEICGDAAIYYPPEDSTAGVDAVQDAVSRLSELKEKGLERTRSFDWSWERYAREFVSAVTEIGCR